MVTYVWLVSMSMKKPFRPRWIWREATGMLSGWFLLEYLSIFVPVHCFFAVCIADLFVRYIFLYTVPIGTACIIYMYNICIMLFLRKNNVEKCEH